MYICTYVHVHVRVCSVCAGSVRERREPRTTAFLLPAFCLLQVCRSRRLGRVGSGRVGHSRVQCTKNLDGNIMYCTWHRALCTRTYIAHVGGAGAGAGGGNECMHVVNCTNILIVQVCGPISSTMYICTYVRCTSTQVHIGCCVCVCACVPRACMCVSVRVDAADAGRYLCYAQVYIVHSTTYIYMVGSCVSCVSCVFFLLLSCTVQVHMYIPCASM